ncbi:MAG: hypothetical protein LUQ54_07015, partial [Methanoregula sp.]|nr:hypothetical protein [Methanoregula sp.]
QVLPPGGVLLLFAILTGVVASTIYTWLTAFDTFSSYTCLPISVTMLLTSKICSFTVLQLIPASFIIFVSIASGGIAYLVPALSICLSVSFYALAVTVRLTGLSPNILVYDARVLLIYLISIGITLIILIALAFVNPDFAMASIFLLIPAWLIVQSSYGKWETEEQQGF